jgi:hypothetical protein
MVHGFLNCDESILEYVLLNIYLELPAETYMEQKNVPSHFKFCYNEASLHYIF